MAGEPLLIDRDGGYFLVAYPYTGWYTIFLKHLGWENEVWILLWEEEMGEMTNGIYYIV